ncbi:glycosyltransferase [Limosilactobacillus sp.]|uniref:glycosyltransferase n=1 Tax=Limosilactobacillus sp. TaxID=2773925 RepID=UPI00345E9D46
MKRLLVISDCVRSSGVTEVIFRIFSRFPKDQYHIDMVGYGEDHTGYSEKQCKKYGWQLNRVIPVTQNPIRHWHWWKEWFKNHQYDIAYFNYSSSWNYLPIVYASKYGHVRKIVCHSHNSYYSHKFSNKLLMFMLNSLNKHGRKVINHYVSVRIATSAKAARWMFGNEANNAVISINGVDISKFIFNASKRALLRKQLGLSNSTYLIGFVGALQSRKNPQFAIQVFDKFHKKHPNSKMIIVGNGPLEASLKKQISNLKLDNDIFFQRYLSNINEWYSAMDALLFTSRYEGVSLVALESQISNLQILASDKNDNVIFSGNTIKKMTDMDVISWSTSLERILSRDIDRSIFQPNLEKFSIVHQSQDIEKLL